MKQYNMTSKVISLQTFFGGPKAGTSDLHIVHEFTAGATVIQRTDRVVTLDHIAIGIDAQLDDLKARFDGAGLEFLSPSDVDIIRKHSLALSPDISVSGMEMLQAGVMKADPLLMQAAPT